MNKPLRHNRVTINLDDDTLAVCRRLASVTHSSVSGAIAAWLVDSTGAIDQIASVIQTYAQEPQKALQRLHMHASATVAQTEELIDELARTGASQGATGRRGPIPPSSNTGGILPDASKCGGDLGKRSAP